MTKRADIFYSVWERMDIFSHETTLRICGQLRFTEMMKCYHNAHQGFQRNVRCMFQMRHMKRKFNFWRRIWHSFWLKPHEILRDFRNCDARVSHQFRMSFTCWFAYWAWTKCVLYLACFSCLYDARIRSPLHQIVLAKSNDGQLWSHLANKWTLNLICVSNLRLFGTQTLFSGLRTTRRNMLFLLWCGLSHGRSKWQLDLPCHIVKVSIKYRLRWIKRM